MDYKHRNLLLKNHTFIVEVTIITLIIIIFTFSKTTYARIRDNKIDIFLEKIEETNKKINTISVDYVQNIFFEFTKEEKKNCGKLFFKKNCGVYINQKIPQEQQIYFDGKNITIYTPKNRQVIIDNWNGAINENSTSTTLLSFIGVCGDLKRMKKTNMIDFVDEDEKYVLVKVTTLSKENCDIKIYISKLNMYPEKIVVKFDGAIMETMFKHYIINSNLDKNMFKFNMSNDIEMVKLN
ncbi:MAG: hypothetical protein Nk1A_3310 [Endomicrobiia bacterium]|nr:MAG: hypothetical protein Nk1A_3310 [Endomicrobiia bacterium]